jgi:hypothetical protein
VVAPDQLQATILPSQAESGFVVPDRALVRIEKEIVVEERGARFLGRFRSRLWKRR